MREPEPGRSSSAGLATVEHWFTARGWTPFAYQRETWSACAGGGSGLVHAPTGTGKTLAALLGAVAAWIDDGRPAPRGLALLWITPLRALAHDTAGAIATALAELAPSWTVELRTGDTSAALKAKQRRRLPTVLVTTPESLSLLLSWPDHATLLAGARVAVVDEWHELLGSKRGVQTELGLARLRRVAPGLRTWGLSATIGNLEQAMDVLLGVDAAQGRLIEARLPKAIALRTLLPEPGRELPWGGRTGLAQLERVAQAIEGATTTLVFANTRPAAELWHQALKAARPGWDTRVAIHHGSLDRDERRRVEQGLRDGTFAAVVCTASLDLGVDFPPVDQVVQIGSPKGVGRLLQRAGRSGHRPGEASRVVGVPTHAFELIEYAAARAALDERRIEPREPLDGPLDVLAQHVVTCSCGGGFVDGELLAEVRSTWAYRRLGDDAWAFTLDFVRRGGAALAAYPRFARIIERDGRWVAASTAAERAHRLAIGTIVSEQAIPVRLLKGRSVGVLDEAFVGRLRPGDAFLFAGKALELAFVRDGVAWVRKARSATRQVPVWSGGRMPISTYLADGVLAALARAGAGGDDPGGELGAAAPVLAIQRRWSRVPGPRTLLVESWQAEGSHHRFLYPFGGRLAHEGLGALLAHRLAARAKRTITVTANDYGIGLASPHPLPEEAAAWRALLAPEHLLEDLLASVDAAELARRRFREIARIAGLLVPDYPGAQRADRQVQATASLLYDVLAQHDPGNLLLAQARREVLEGMLEYRRMRAVLERVRHLELDLVATPRLTPLSFPLWTELEHAHVSSEPWADRVARMAARLADDADADPGSAHTAPSRQASKTRRG